MKILFVEDNEDDTFFIERACSKAGVAETKEFCRNGEEALSALNAASETSRANSLPNLIFLDLNMPFMGGIEFLGNIRKLPVLSTIPVVVLTTSENRTDVQSAYRAGANAYIVKPSDLDELAEMLKCATQFWLKHNRAI